MIFICMKKGKLFITMKMVDLLLLMKMGPWELEHNAVIAQNVNETTSIELEYHNGRSPFNNFYFLHTSYIGISVRFNPNNTIKLFETNK